MPLQARPSGAQARYAPPGRSNRPFASIFSRLAEYSSPCTGSASSTRPFAHSEALTCLDPPIANTPATTSQMTMHHPGLRAEYRYLRSICGSFPERVTLGRAIGNGWGAAAISALAKGFRSLQRRAGPDEAAYLRAIRVASERLHVPAEGSSYLRMPKAPPIDANWPTITYNTSTNTTPRKAA